MTFVTGPLVSPLGCLKQRAYLRESAFLPRESIPTSTVLDCQSVWCVFTYSLVPITRHVLLIVNSSITQTKKKNTENYLREFKAARISLNKVCKIKSCKLKAEQ